ncbi:uncharacterized protein TRAVEDRAFT_50565 [Trametes versicolor FP-101664 SS1]|uniref:uncharacterized protein n=1 Tax=Trametes versicolor (strain FP-101664) TaxID=717944 RepID=UPI0004624240|nr:uncharacterized protein TRAVEDRAFT_50565 [Trametes versicolor FP-101664 SS1]EIW56077.1 hypothetical protein TRAVEDRAFT_50565 [Trametes versicolor FP-101664 SS1]
MYPFYPTPFLVGFVLTAEALALPLASPALEEVYSATMPLSSIPTSSASTKEMPDDPESDTMSFDLRGMPLVASPEDAEMSERASRHLPNPSTIPLLGRGDEDPSANLSNASTDSCQIAVGLLREDFAGHGLPLTSLVIESSTLLLLAGYVLYFLCRTKLRRRPMVYLSAANTPVSFTFPHRESIFKHTPPTAAQPSIASLSKIDEDSLPPTPTQSAPGFYSHLAALSPLRGPPSSPARAVSRAASFCTRSGSSSTACEGGSLEKKSSFLSLKG